ncbi:MAG: universal stress protein [Anaerolineae bacterium]|jgi:hypothetical protein
MGPIVCATRGGEAGRRTQEQAISLAKERDAALIFLSVFDPSFAEPFGDTLAAAVVEEQRWLGRALLGAAQVRARTEGVDADAVVLCCGPVLETIEGFLRDVDASVLIIGKPKTSSTLAAFQAGTVHHFAQQVRQDTGVEVLVITPKR